MLIRMPAAEEEMDAPTEMTERADPARLNEVAGATGLEHAFLKRML
jgi:hypothetical protein